MNRTRGNLNQSGFICPGGPKKKDLKALKRLNEQ